MLKTTLQFLFGATFCQMWVWSGFAPQIFTHFHQHANMQTCINDNMNTARKIKKRDKSKDLHPPASPPTHPSYTIHLHTGPGILFTDWFIWTFYSFVLFCGEQQIISWWVLMVEGIFASCFKEKKKSPAPHRHNKQLAQELSGFCPDWLNSWLHFLR